MEFGKVDPQRLDSIDHRLPRDTKRTLRVLNDNRKPKGTIRFGCAKWGRKDWVGLIYPRGTKDSNFLTIYSDHFRTIELNATFYRIFPAETISTWVDQTADDFLFCPKFFQSITHFRRLRNCEQITDQFLASISHFGKKLGPIFLQLPPNFHPKHFHVLAEYLQSLPQELNIFVEVRHPLWFTQPIRSEYFDLLQSTGFGAVITDTSGRRDMLHMELPIPKAFVRFVGNNLHPTDYPRIDDWIRRIKKWKRQGIDEIFFMMHQHDESNTPIISIHTIERLNKECNASLVVPQLLEQGKSSG